MTLAITICATAGYAYAMRSQARLLVANIAAHATGVVILATDASPQLAAVRSYYQQILPYGWTVTEVSDPSLQEHENYQAAAQLVIARLRSLAFTEARRIRADLCWSLDSDTLPPANALRCLEHTLGFDGGYYAVAAAPYPNESYLGGRGTPQNPILPSIYEDERIVPPRLKAALEACRARLQKETTPKEEARHARLVKRVENCPPLGNVFELNARGWRPRGWLDSAYPGIGKGAMLPSDWCGFGCTLLNAQALAHAHFEGYDGRGTEDLYIVWRRWHQVGLRINVIPHVLCDHVIHEKKKGGPSGAYTHLRAYHETDGPQVGHIRTQKTPWLYD